MKPVCAIAEPMMIGSVHSAAAVGAASDGAASAGAAADSVAAGASEEVEVEAQPASTRLRLAATARMPAALVLFICSPLIPGEIN